MRGYVLFDVDGTLIDHAGQPIPETMGLVRIVRLLDFEVVLWSAAGADHAAQTAQRVGLGDVRCFTKPARPEEKAALQVDNDASHRIGDWPFIKVAS